MTEEELKIQDEWMSETVEKVKKGNWWYKFFCFMMGKRKKKMTYKEVFLLIYGLNKNKLGDKTAKEIALYKILEIYINNHGKLPKGVKLKKGPQF